ncbi:GNAT family N-acetyltransferase [Kosmotoga arenicorallina]|nr:GNAT family N-acetyltransferase [Kosmotoga arenicorallina]
MIKIRKLELDDLQENALDNFNRYQLTTCVKYIKNGKNFYKENFFEEDWDIEKKRKIVKYLRSCIEAGGIVIGAINRNDEIIGFGSLRHSLFGSKKEYIELSYLHVSKEYRNKGIGKKLFIMCCEYAKQLGAKKLYMGTHPSVETQHFYESLGCIPAREINEEIYNHEPLDIQLEYNL